MQTIEFGDFVAGTLPAGWSCRDSFLLDVEIRNSRPTPHMITEILTMRQAIPGYQATPPPGNIRFAGVELPANPHGAAGFARTYHVGLLDHATTPVTEKQRDRVLLAAMVNTVEPLSRGIHWLMQAGPHQLDTVAQTKIFESWPVQGKESQPPEWVVEIAYRVTRVITADSVGRSWTIRYDPTLQGWRLAVDESPPRDLPSCFDEFAETAKRYLPLTPTL